MTPDPWDHPENDLTADADFTNRMRPAPKNLDELLDEPDPLVVAAANRRSTRQAIAWAVGTPVVTFLTAFVLAVVSRSLGGPLCEGGAAVWICSRAAEIWWPLATSVVPLGGALGSGVILYRKYLAYQRWRPWMGTFWFLIPFAMLWMVTVLQMAIIGH